MSGCADKKLNFFHFFANKFTKYTWLVAPDGVFLLVGPTSIFSSLWLWPTFPDEGLIGGCDGVWMSILFYSHTTSSVNRHRIDDCWKWLVGVSSKWNLNVHRPRCWEMTEQQPRASSGRVKHQFLPALTTRLLLPFSISFLDNIPSKQSVIHVFANKWQLL